MNNLTVEETILLKRIIFKSYLKNIQDVEYLKDMSIIYGKLFNKDLKTDYITWQIFMEGE